MHVCGKHLFVQFMLILYTAAAKSPEVVVKQKPMCPEVKLSANQKKNTTSYDPSKEKYDPLADACWNQGQKYVGRQ